MEKATKEQFLDRLQNSWQPLVDRFYSLEQPEQQAFLEKQGYATFPDLLAHIIAWWQDGVEEVAQMRKDASLRMSEMDVDAFNAAAVKKFGTMSKDAVIRVYETQRQVMVDLVKSLPKAELNYDNINLRLYYEILGHWREHELN